MEKKFQMNNHVIHPNPPNAFLPVSDDRESVLGERFNRTFGDSVNSSFYNWDQEDSYILGELDNHRGGQNNEQQLINHLSPIEPVYLQKLMEQQQKIQTPFPQMSQQNNRLPEQQQQQKPVMVGQQKCSQFLNLSNGGKLCETIITEYVSEDFHSQVNSPQKEQDYRQCTNRENIRLRQLTVLESQADENIISSSQVLVVQNDQSVLSILKEQELEKPIYLNVMVVGAQGLGKSTFIDAFLNRKFTKDEDVIRATTQDITEQRGTRRESKINLHLQMVDTPGYTESSEIEVWLSKIIDYITVKFEQYEMHEDEQLKDRKSVQQEDDKDGRIHVCLYFLSGPRIQNTDLLVMGRLQEYVNIIPILAKGDCYTPEEVFSIKAHLIKDAHDKNIQWFDCETPLKNSPEKLEKLRNGPLGYAPPFLMISSVKKMEIEKYKFQYARKYPWGICRIEDPEHSDFLLLYQLLIGYFLTDLKKLTEYNYKKYLRDQKKRLKQLKKQERYLKRQQQFCQGGILAVIGLGAVFSYFRIKNK